MLFVREKTPATDSRHLRAARPPGPSTTLGMTGLGDVGRSATYIRSIAPVISRASASILVSFVWKRSTFSDSAS
jgi:hypothetical protein